LALINKNLAIYVARLASLSFGMFASLFLIRQILTVNGHNAAPILSLITLAGFVNLISLGYPRYSYAKAVDALKNGSLFDSAKERIASALFALKVVGVILYTVITLYSFSKSNDKSHMTEGVWIVVGYSMTVLSQFSKDFFYIQNKELNYELLEIIRKISLIIGAEIYGSGLGGALSGLVIIGAVSITWLYELNLNLINKGKIKKYIITELHTCIPKSYHLTIFACVEMAYYYFPMLYVSYANDSVAIIICALWMRLFFILPIPHRIYIELEFNRSLKKMQGLISVHSVNKIIVGALILAFLSGLIYYNASDYIIKQVDKNGLVNVQSYFTESLVIWTMGNSIQHIYGVVCTSYTSGGKRVLQSSMMQSIIVVLTFGISYQVSNSLSVGMLFSGFAYTVCALFFALQMKKIINENN
jgi:hypothetical protein